MKKLKIITLIILFTVIGLGVFYACTKEEKVRTLTEELAILNNNIASKIEMDQSSKGFWSRVGQVCAVAGADLVGAWEGGQIGGSIGGLIGGPYGAGAGAIIGGAVVGGGASYAAYRGVAKSISDPYPDGFVSTLSSKYSDLNIIGELHNKYLDLLYKTNGNPDINVVYNQIFSNVLDRASFDKVMTEVNQNSETYRKIQTITNNYVASDYDISVLIGQIKSNFGMSKDAEEIWYSFFNVYFSVTKISDAYFVIENYIDFTNEKSTRFLLSDEIKLFSCALNTALHSTNYWSILID